MAAEVTFLRATRAHAETLAASMRSADSEECLALGYADGREALLASLEVSDVAYTMFIGAEPAAMFGVSPAVTETTLGRPRVGVVWLLTGEAVNRHPKAFVRWSRPAVSVLLEHCPILTNIVDARYEAALRWAKWVGFEVGEAVPLRGNSTPFCRIVLRRSSWVQD